MKSFSICVNEGVNMLWGLRDGHTRVAAERVAKWLLAKDGSDDAPETLWGPLAEAMYQQGPPVEQRGLKHAGVLYSENL